ncbi:hypothetical protein VL10_24170 [Leclercia adecarboxylata]|nr:hypothetical protein VL10_24170 [Leclercia adecarboxylata]KMN66767.1 hypothetical protein VK95_04610 [Leclercia sp. LK8]
MELTLKLLNGPMAGRSLRLPAGDLSVGVGDVDLQLALEGEITRVTLRVSPQGEVSLCDPVPCWIEGRRLQDERLPTGKIIDLAGLAFVLLAEGETFTERRIPERLPPGRWRLSRLQRRIAAGIVLAILLCAAAIAFYWEHHRESETDKVARLGIQRWLAVQHRQDSVKTLGFEWLQDGTVRIYGQCRWQKSLTGILEQLYAAGVFWRLETQCQDQLLEQVSALLEQSGYQDTEVTNGRYLGEVEISGDIQADEHWRSVVQQLASMEGLKRWSVRGHSSSQGRGLLEAVRKAGLMGLVNVEKQGQRLIVSGQLSAVQRKKLADGLVSLRQEIIFQQIPPQGMGNEQVFPQPLVSIGGNRKNPWLVLADGRRLQVGAVLSNEYEIVNIDPSTGIDLFRRGTLLHLPMTF